MNGMELKELLDVTVAKAVKEFAEKLRNKYGKSCSEYYPELIELTSIELDETLKEYEND